MLPANPYFSRAICHHITLGRTGFVALLLALVLLSVRVYPGQTPPGSIVMSSHPETVRFVPLDIFVDPAGQHLAAYQIVLSDTTGSMKIVGLEGGEHPAFTAPPYYDPEALSRDRIIVAAFSTADDVPDSTTRVATIHLLITGPLFPECRLDLQVAASPDGTPIQACAFLVWGEER